MSRLDEATWPEVGERAEAGDVLVVPLGSTEQHGPHLPVTTDTDIAVALCDLAAGQLDRMVVAPPLAYGASGEHQGFPGTLSIGQEATTSVLIELGRSASVDFSQIIVVSTHGGNAVPLQRALHRLAFEGHPVLAWSPTWSGDLHAGRTETSLMLAIAPNRVRLDRAEAGDCRSGETLLPLLRHRGVRPVSGNGVLGDPAGASAEEGRILLDRAVADLVGRAQHLVGQRDPTVAGEAR